MSAFIETAAYYNLLYSDKDYFSEVDYIRRLFAKHSSSVKSILDFGCGTGVHASHFVKLGYEVHGLDLKEQMLAEASRLREGLPSPEKHRLTLERADIRNFRYSRKFDAIVSLFHVLSYQTDDSDLTASMETAAAHLDRDGVFIFDCWYGPAVLNLKPQTRVKRLQSEQFDLTRIAEPEMKSDTNCVEVSYDIFIKDKRTGTITNFSEVHSMRFLFLPEIKGLLSDAGLTFVHAEEFLTSESPSVESWNLCVIARA